MPRVWLGCVAALALGGVALAQEEPPPPPEPADPPAPEPAPDPPLDPAPEPATQAELDALKAELHALRAAHDKMKAELEDVKRRQSEQITVLPPPWGKLVAVNANTGEIAWESVLGLNPALPEGKQLVGNVGSAGPTVTAGGVVFVGATNDRRFRAFDARTGAELWSATLSNNAGTNPMSYGGRSGKQRVAIVAGDTVNVFALP